ncbi:MAG: Mov34/MPN/PAD family protein [Ilumatobacteraceae bacterium]|nr:Mov34/MPN/PAD family protein [Ilumatobacteraceae bacterium]
MSDAATPTTGSVGSVPCSVIVRDSALVAMDRHMSDDTAIEYGGVLVGTADPLIGLVIVTGHEPLPDSETTDTVTFTRETWDEMTRLVMTRHPGQRIVGWYHSHPRFGIFLSAHDLSIQTTFFSQPWQVAYVFDPVQHERGLFGWANYDIVRIPEWEIATTVAGIATNLPAHVPAHGEYITARLAEEAAAPTVDEAPVIHEVPVAASAAAAAPLPTSFEAPPPSAPAPDGGGVGWRRVLIALLLVAVVAGAAIAYLVNRSDDSSTAATTTTATTVAATTSTTATTTPVASTEVATTVVDTSVVASTDVSTPPTDAATTTSVEPATTVPVGTPTAVTAPAARAGSTACVPGADGKYTPTADCFVPLNNGNVLEFKTGGALLCADPAATQIGTVTNFSVGVDGDPLALFGDGTLVPKCGDLSYAKNILAGGASTLDGLCGGSNTSIGDGSLRCFAQNGETGAMAALVGASGNSGAIDASCYSTGGTPTAVPLTWTKTGVDTTWRITSLVFDATTKQFTASATRNGVPTAAKFDCA